MENFFKIEIVSPEKKIFFDENVTEVVIPSYEGEMGIMKDHISLISFLKPGIIQVLKNSEKKGQFFIEDGIAEFSENCLILLSSKIINLKDLNKEKIDEIIKKTETSLKKNKLNDDEKYLVNHKIDTLRSINLN
tara:strand:- start:212 stop:613 length:402 start_codon:yes stop_codon:yes gene_type:complete